MELYDIIFYLIYNILRIYVSVCIIRVFLRPDSDRKKFAWIVYGLFWAVNSFFYLKYSIPDFTLFTNIVGLLGIAVVLYNGTVKKKLIAVLATIALGMICEDSAWFVMDKIFPAKGGDIAGSLFTVFLLLIVEILLERHFNLEEDAPMSGLNCIFMILIPLSSMIVVDVMEWGAYPNKYLELVGLSAVMLINIFMFYLYDKILKAFTEKRKRRMLEEQIAMYRNQFALIRQSQDDLRSFRHDLKHHILMIGEYNRRGMQEELSEYLEQISENTEVEKEYVRTGNEEVDSVLNYQIQRAKKIGAEVTVHVQVPKTNFMPAFDINMLLSNILENAVEALRSCEEKKLSIYLKIEKGILYISIYNTYSGRVVCRDGMFESVKQNKEEHGIGIHNVKKIVEKYGGECNMACENGYFKVDIFLYLKSE